MTLEQYASVAEIIGVMLVIASLMYVAQQIRQNTEMMRAESRNEVHHSKQQELFTLMEYPEVWRALANRDLDDEGIRLSIWLTASIRAREHEWFLLRHGALDKKAWETYSTAMTVVLANERPRAWWDGAKSAFDNEFVEMVDELLKEPLGAFYSAMPQATE